MYQLAAPGGTFKVGPIVELCKAGQLAEAEALFEKTLPSHAYVFDASVVEEIVALHKCGQKGLAQKLYDSRVNFFMAKFTPGRLLLYNDLMSSIFAGGLRDEARDMFKRMITRDSNKRAVHHTLYEHQKQVYITEGSNKERAERANARVSVMRRFFEDEAS